MSYVLSYGPGGAVGGVGTANLADDSVTFAKMQNMGFGVLAQPVFGQTVNGAMFAPSGGFQVLVDNNAGALAWATLEPRSMAAHAAISGGTPFAFFVDCPASGAAGTADDVTVWNANARFNLRILDVLLYTSTAVAAATCTLRDASGGGGNALSSALAVTSTGVARNNDTATRTISTNGSAFLRRTDRSHVGQLVIIGVRT